MKRSIASTCVVLLAVFFLFVTCTVFGQGNLGAITGTVQDSSGAVVPDLPLTITNVETGVKWTATTSSAGYYRVAVPPGTYRLETQKQGFKTQIADKIIVPVAQVVTVDIALQVGNQSQTVEVNSAAPLLTPSSAEVGSSVSPQEFETLPIEVGDGGRQLQTFIFTSLPGTVGNTFSGSINGGQLFSHEILIDGVTIGRYDLSGGSLDEFSPGTDAIGEFKVQTSNYSAEYGETGGGIANFSYKSGTNDFHGSLFEYNKNPMFNAAGVLVNTFGGQKDNQKENNFGGTIGGPIRKDHTFFFFNYEGDRFRSFAFAGKMSLPTAAMKAGDFSSWLGTQNFCGPDPDNNPQPCFDALNRPVFKNEIYDPTTTRNVTSGVIDPVTGRMATADGVIRDPFSFGGNLNVIPPGEFSKATSVLLPLIPDPSLPGNVNNSFRLSGCCPILSRNAYTAKIDHVLTSKQKVWGSFTWNHRDRYNRNNSRTFLPFPGQPMNPVKRQIVGGPQVRIAHAWTISSRSVNEFSVGYNRFQNKNNITDNATFTPQLGIPGLPNDCFPPMRFSGHNSSGFAPLFGVGCKNVDPSESYVYQDTYSYLRGKHSLKFGGEIRRYRYNTFEPGPLSGDFSFNDLQTALPDFPGDTGHPFASFILGAVRSANRSIYTTEPGYRAGLYAFFAQDDFKATPKLTLNLGLRWELPMPQREVLNRESGFDPSAPNPGADNIPGALVFLGSCQTCIHRNSFQDWYFKEFGPRIGVAYQIQKNVVFRGGYGISYGAPIENNFGSQNLFGFNSGAPLIIRSSPTGFKADPAAYWSTLVSAPLPAAARVGVPAFTGTLPNRDPASANGQTLDFMPRSAAAQPYAQNWSAGLQYLFPHDILLQADYVGSKGTRLLNGYFGFWFNQTPSKYMGLGELLYQDLECSLANCDPSFPNAAATLAQYGITGLPYPNFENNNWDTSVATALMPFPQYSGLVNNYPAFGNSTYHSLQLMARKTTAHGLSFIGAYTFSKTLTDTDSALYASGSQVVQDFYNRKADKAIASFDFPHVVKLTWIYELPFGHGKKWLNANGPLDRLVSGWQLTAIQNYRSGDPLVIVSSLDPGNFALQMNGLRADLVPGVPQRLPSSGLDVTNGTPYLNPGAFADPPSSASGQPLRIGNSPGFLPHTRGPGHSNEDFGIVKNTRITERVAAQFRADMFNVFNRTGRGDPDTCLCDGLPGAPDFGTFGLILDPGNDPRVIQLALRLTF